MSNYNWGILATGKIAATFAKAINFTEGATLYAAASRTVDKAKAFAEQYGAQKYYGSYDELAQDKNVDVIYIASPMAQHYENAKMCLLAGKNVLCEKTITLNSAQLAELTAIAKEKNVFFMEAMWMKLLPAFRKAKEWADSGRIGEVRAIKADFSNLCPYDENDRLFKSELGGGCLLDLGVYPITLACEFFSYEPKEIISDAFIGKSGVDFDASIVLRYQNGYADICAGFDMENNNPAYIIGSKGRIRFGNWFFCTGQVMLYDDDGNMLEEFNQPHPCNGYEFEVMHVMDCLDRGLKESDINPLSHTAATQKIMDKCRKDWGLVFEGE
ncbi:MAG: Gfo/Idh/MocA family oxidoreductase [Eubacterium sp.]|nr:Gfo/Idh/MocA family oxidoreductase [Eubacterium sp.]